MLWKAGINLQICICCLPHRAVYAWGLHCPSESLFYCTCSKHGFLVDRTDVILVQFCSPQSPSQSMWGPFKGTAWDSKGFHLLQYQSPLVLWARSYGEFSSWHYNTWLWGLVWSWNPCSRDIPLNFYLPHMGVGPAHSKSPPLPPTSLNVVSSLVL